MRIHVTIYYTNGTTKDYKFHTYSEADWFIHNEGDHVLHVEMEEK